MLGSFVAVIKQEGVLGLWKGNLAQVLRVLPYSAAQLSSYEVLKGMLADEDGKLSLQARLAAGAGAGMFATLVSWQTSSSTGSPLAALPRM